MFIRSRVLLLLAFIISPFTVVQGKECFEPEKPFDVIVIGAGIAGLAAAHELQISGKNVLVIEGDSRIGGRINSINPWGSNLELGASWINGVKENPLGKLAKSLNLQMEATAYNHKCLECRFSSFALYDSRGKKIDATSMKQLKKFAGQFMQYLKELGGNPSFHYLTVAQALERFKTEKNVPAHLRAAFHYLATLMVSLEQAGDLSKMSVMEFEKYSELGPEGDNVLLTQGFDQLTNHLAKNLKILLNDKVSKISYNLEGYSISIQTKSGQVFKAKNAIVTLPLGVLKKGDVQFDPALPWEKVQAITQLEMGIMNKTYLFFPCPFWDENVEWIGYVPEDITKGYIEIFNLSKYANQPVLSIITAGSFAKEMEGWDTQKTIDYMMPILKKMYGDKIPLPSANVMTKWGQNPFAYGSSSFLSFASKPDSYEVMAKPIGKLYFAGEAYSKSESGTVNGAYMSGIDTAKQILKKM